MNTNRNKLISLAVKYNGDLNTIKKAIVRGEGDPNFELENCITVLDEEYPKELLDLEDYPLVLFYKGNLDLLKARSIAVIGSRQPCEYSKNATREFVQNQNYKVIISGLAKGIDTIAHTNANKTIAVLGCGIDYIYPYKNKELYEKIAEEGLILSEYPFKHEPTQAYFLRRNRIVAALAEEIFVMEAKKNSGTISTINHALACKRKITVLPQPLTNKNCINNNLISGGANILTSLEEKL